MGLRVRRLDLYIAVVGLVTLLWACWAGKGLLYDLEYDLPASRFPYADNAVGSDFTGTGSGGTTWAMAEKHDLKNFQHVMAERKHDLTQLQLRHEQSFKDEDSQKVDAHALMNLPKVEARALMKLQQIPTANKTSLDTFTDKFTNATSSSFELFTPNGNARAHARPADMRSDFQSSFRRGGRMSDPTDDERPAWAFYPGDNIPKEYPLPPEGNPVVHIYAVNHRSRMLYFAQGIQRFNEIPPKAVARQATFANENWKIVDELNAVFKELTVQSGNQVIEIEALPVTPVPLTADQADEAEGRVPVS